MRISIRNLGLGIGAVLTLLVAYLSVSAINDRLNDKTLAKRGLEITTALELGYRALMPLSLERSVTQVGLTLETPLPAQFASLLMEQRRVSEQHLNALMAHLEQTSELPNKQETLNALKAARSNLTALRVRADAAVSAPRQNRPSNVETLPQEIIAAIRDMQSALGNLIDTAAMRIAKSEHAVLAAYRIWRVREYEGQSRTYIAAALLNQQPMTPAATKASSELTGKAEVSFEALKSMQRLLPAALLPSLQAIDSAYDKNYGALRTLALSGAATGNYPVDFASYFARLGEALGQI